MIIKPAKIGLTSMVRRIDGVSVTNSGDGIFLIDARSGFLFRLNRTAQFVWELLGEPMPVGQLCGRVATAYGISEADSVLDVSNLLALLLDAGLIGVHAAPYESVE
jgi:Coenzyme PQQ synthesis protein D (PqqD)